MSGSGGALLEATVTVDYDGKPGVLHDLALRLACGEIYALAGQSGAGKSTLALAILGLLDRRRAQVRGRILFEGCDLLSQTESALRRVRGARISMVPQSPLAALNPYLRLGRHLREAWLVHKRGQADLWKAEAFGALRRVQLPPAESLLKLYPRQLSVGMAQRFLIALAILHRPELLIADEATSALDLITQAEILRLFQQLNRTDGVGILFITHDLAAAASLCQRIGILHEGRIVEEGPVESVFRKPGHPYTQRLVRSLPGAPVASELLSAAAESGLEPI
jgi:peptide/nickel transport system ATP-binding protein